MPELVIDFITSLDGYGAAEGWPGWWGLEGPEYLAWLEDDSEGDYTTLMGANTYRLMSGLASEGEPGTDALAGLSKVVFSTTLTEPLSWPNTQLVTQDPVQAVREMKDNAATSLRTLGSLTLCRSLLKAGLVDRFRVVVFPVITGASGRDRVGDLSGVPVAGALGDQSASLFGHTCFDHGDMKSAYGTGAFLLFTLGTKPVMSEQRPDHYGRMEAW
jgi:dihydrofolate reductase